MAEKGLATRIVSQTAFAGASLLKGLGVRPNILTWCSLLPAIASGIAAAWGAFYIATALLLLSALCDFFDGPLARVSGTVSRMGALLDSTIDRLVDAAPFLGLIVFYSRADGAALVPALALLGGYTVSYVRARAEALDIVLPQLWMRRPERLLLTGLALMLVDIDLPTIEVPMTLVIISVLAVLSFLAAAHELWIASRLLTTTTARK